MNIIQKFTNLDWFRYHGKQTVISYLQQQGFYDIKISRKMNLEESSSYIKISGLCLSTEEGAIYGSINIYKDGIQNEDDTASNLLKELIENTKENFFYEGISKSKKPYYYRPKKIIYK